MSNKVNVDYNKLFPYPSSKQPLDLSTMPFSLDVINILPSGRSLKLVDKHNRVLLVEPYSLSWVALMLSEGILKGLGTKIFNDLSTKDINLAKLQHEIFNKVNHAIQYAINEDALRRCESRLEALSTLMKQYNNSPNTSIDRLHNASNEIVSLVAECKSLGFKAILPYCTAVNLQIIILQERMNRFNEQGELKNIINLCNTSYSYIFDEAFPAFRQWSDSRFTELLISIISMQPYKHIYRYQFNGIPYYAHTNDEKKAKEVRKEHMDREANLSNDNLCGSSWDIAKKWQEIKSMYESL